MAQKGRILSHSEDKVFFLPADRSLLFCLEIADSSSQPIAPSLLSKIAEIASLLLSRSQEASSPHKRSQLPSSLSRRLPLSSPHSKTTLSTSPLQITPPSHLLSKPQTPLKPPHRLLSFSSQRSFPSPTNSRDRLPFSSLLQTADLPPRRASSQPQNTTPRFLTATELHPESPRSHRTPRLAYSQSQNSSPRFLAATELHPDSPRSHRTPRLASSQSQNSSPRFLAVT